MGILIVLDKFIEQVVKQLFDRVLPESWTSFRRTRGTNPTTTNTNPNTTCICTRNIDTRVNPPTCGERWQCCCIVTTLMVIAAGIIIALVMLRVKTPKLGMVGAMLTSLSVGTPQTPWLQANITAEFALKNPNFGPYHYRNTTLDFFYEGAMVGQVPIPTSGVGKRSTKKMFLIAPLYLNAAKLSADLSQGVVRITSSAGMRGRVIGRERSTNYLICVMQIVTPTQSITNLLCQWFRHPTTYE